MLKQLFSQGPRQAAAAGYGLPMSAPTSSVLCAGLPQHMTAVLSSLRPHPAQHSFRSGGSGRWVPGPLCAAFALRLPGDSLPVRDGGQTQRRGGIESR